MKNLLCSAAIALVSTAIFVPNFVQAELPPSAYEQMQSDATEVFRLSILQVTKTATDDPHETVIRIVADVVKVGRATAKIRPGDIIAIRYTVSERPPGWVGPGEVPVPAEGSELPAFLKPIPDSVDYAPAAGAMTFETFR